MRVTTFFNRRRGQLIGCIGLTAVLLAAPAPVSTQGHVRDSVPRPVAKKIAEGASAIRIIVPGPSAEMDRLSAAYGVTIVRTLRIGAVLSGDAIEKIEKAFGPDHPSVALALGNLANEHFAGLGERDHRWGGAGALRVRDDRGLAALEYRDTRVGGSEVNSYCT